MSTFVLPNGVTLATEAKARHLEFDDRMLHCELEDGRVIGVPLAWYPRLRNANPEQRNDFEIIAGGYGIHWPQLDEDLLVSGFLAGCNEEGDEQPESFGGTDFVLRLINMTSESKPPIPTNYRTQVSQELVVER